MEECPPRESVQQSQVCDRAPLLASMHANSAQREAPSIARSHLAPTVTAKSQRERGGRQKRPRQDDNADHLAHHHKKQMIALPKGLRNISSACFSNASLQLLDAALTPAQVAQLPGPEVSQDFELQAYAVDGLQGKKLTSALKRLNQVIKEASPIAPAPYMGRLLKELHSDRGPVVDPLVFQRVFAMGSRVKSREAFSGDSQEDANEYLRALISAVGEEYGFVSDTFQYQTTEAIICTAPNCRYRNELSSENGTLLEARIPAVTTPAPCKQVPRQNKAVPPAITTDALIEAHFGDAMCEGSRCETCKAKNTLARRTQMAEYPNHLLISLNRTTFAQAGGRACGTRRGAVQSATKDTTEVKLNLGDIRVGRKGVYRVVALMKHSGDLASNGHYSAYRKVDGGSWAILEDDVVKSVPERNLADGVKGYSSVLLLQRQRS